MIDDQVFLQQVLQGFYDYVLVLFIGVCLIGFVEIWYLMVEVQFFEYLDFLCESYFLVFLVLNSCDFGDVFEVVVIIWVMVSFVSYVVQYFGSSLILCYVDFIGDEQGLCLLFDWLGLFFDVFVICKVLVCENFGIDVLLQFVVFGMVQNGVLIGCEGWLFLWGGLNDVQWYFIDFGYFMDCQVFDWVGLLECCRQWLVVIGVIYCYLIVFDKIVVLLDYLGFVLFYFDYYFVCQFVVWLDVGLNIDILDDLWVEVQWQLVFYCIDMYWILVGCQIVYCCICELLGVMLCSFFDFGYKGCVMVMDLGNKLIFEV